MKNKYTLGPILNLYKTHKDKLEISILVVSENDSFVVERKDFSILDNKQIIVGKYKINRTLIEIELSKEEQQVIYTLNDSSEQYSFNVPVADANPRVAFCSCNGFSSGKEAKKVSFKNNMWKSRVGFPHDGILDVHEKERFHLLVMGGDQVYADSIWEEIEELNNYQELDFDEKVGFKVDSNLESKLDQFYFDLYVKRWSNDELNYAFSSIPTIMMWDDHDIFDGFGSYPEDLQNSELFNKIFKFADKYFRIFQMHFLDDKEVGGCFSSIDYSNLKEIGNLGILSLDLRRNRSIDSVVNAETWEKIFDYDYTDLDHLFVCSSIPVVHPDMSWIDDVAGFLLPHQHEDKFELLDDLRDHWNSREHKKERIRLVYNLFKVHSQKTRVSILSGDVHVAAMGIIENSRYEGSKKAVINQFTSSGIVHPGPPSFMTFVYDLLSKRDQEFDRGIAASMIKFPGTNQRFTNKRNWMSFIPGRGKYWANLYIENERGKHEKAIHDVE